MSRQKQLVFISCDACGDLVKSHPRSDEAECKTFGDCGKLNIVRKKVRLQAGIKHQTGDVVLLIQLAAIRFALSSTAKMQDPL